MKMGMGPGYERQMMLTPKMLLNAHVLQLNIMDLRMFMRAELEENPLLDEVEADGSANENEEKIKLDEKISMLIDDSSRQPVSPENDGIGYSVSEEKRRYLESLITKKESLYGHLYWQLQVLSKNDEDVRIGEFIIGNLDENGFLTMGIEKMREFVKVDIDRFKNVLRLVRSLDPAGVAARDIKESLLLQLFLSGKGDSHLYRIVFSYLDELKKGHFKKIAEACSISVEEVIRAKKRISSLNPRPGISFGGRDVVSKIEPDVFLNRKKDSYSVEVNEEDLPKFRVSAYYHGILKDKAAPEKTKEYIKKKFSNALWIIDALAQRKKTIARTCQYLVEVQKDFLEKGDSLLKPLTLKQAAEGLSVSEATVSRVVSNKYAQEENRLLELKRFFAGRVKTAGGGAVSTWRVKRRIQELIETEAPAGRLSDETITDLLNKEGIEIARRTVSKYRESLDILPSHLRRDEIIKSCYMSSEDEGNREKNA